MINERIALLEARIALLEQRLHMLEGNQPPAENRPTERKPWQSFDEFAWDVQEAIRTLGGSARLPQIAAIINGGHPASLKRMLLRMERKGLLVRERRGMYRLP